MSLRTIVKSRTLALVLIAAAAFGGTVGGIYVARGGSETLQPGPQHAEGCESGGLFLTFGPGDPFPDERCRTRSGTEGAFSDLLAGNNTVLLFVDFACEPCVSLVKAWNAELSRHLRNGSQAIFCTSVLKGIPEEYRRLCDSLNLVYYDFDYWFNEYGLTASPVLIGVDANRIVTHVQLGFSGRIDLELSSRYFEPLL